MRELAQLSFPISSLRPTSALRPLTQAPDTSRRPPLIDGLGCPCGGSFGFELVGLPYGVTG